MSNGNGIIGKRVVFLNNKDSNLVVLDSQMDHRGEWMLLCDNGGLLEKIDIRQVKLHPADAVSDRPQTASPMPARSLPGQ